MGKPLGIGIRGRPGNCVGAQTRVLGFGYGNRIAVAQFVKADAVGFSRGESGERGDKTNAERQATDLQRNVDPGGATATKSAGDKADKVVPTFCPMAIPDTRTRVRNSSGKRLGNTPLKPW